MARYLYEHSKHPTNRTDRAARGDQNHRIQDHKIYDMVNKGAFPKKVHLGTRSVRWVKAEVLQWANDQMAARERRA